MKTLALPARAKINIFLKVGPRRADGFHSLRTEFQEISLHDRLTFQILEAPVFRLTVSGASLPVDSNNLVIRALAALRLKLKVHQGMRVHLTKQIPVGAGLGGGSSDAATALWAGWLLWMKKPYSSFRQRIPPVLKKLAPQLGADVAFFLSGGRAAGRGKGEILKFLPAQPRRWIRSCPSARARVDGPSLWMVGSRPTLKKNLSFLKNDFELSVFKRVPAVARVKKELERWGCRDVLMSGSGSSVFGFVPSKTQGASVIRHLDPSRWDCFLVQTVF